MIISARDLKTHLTDFRNALRSGAVVVLSGNFHQAFEDFIGPTLELPPRSAERLNKLFDVPYTTTQIGSIVRKGWPTPDNYAWAVQNFINRRSDPWAFKRSRKVELPPEQAAA